jgi:hypothetical protein
VVFGAYPVFTAVYMTGVGTVLAKLSSERSLIERVNFIDVRRTHET